MVKLYSKNSIIKNKYISNLILDNEFIVDKKFNLLDGKNGTGKTTLLNEIYFQNKENTSYISQNFSFFQNISFEDNIKLIFDKLDKNIVDALGINHIIDKKFDNMSTGEYHKLIFYLALCIDNNLILIDEIDNHVDMTSINNFYNLLYKKNNTYLIVSHLANPKNFDCEFSIVDKHIIKNNYNNLNDIKDECNGEKFKFKYWKLLLIKQKYILILILNFILLFSFSVISGYDRNVVEEYNNDVYASVLNVSIKKDNQVISPNFNNLSVLNSNPNIEIAYIDILNSFDDAYGLKFIDNNKKKSYPSLLFNDLKFENNGIYLSKYDINCKSVKFKLNKTVKYNDYYYNLSVDDEISVLGYLDIPQNTYIYDYDCFENYLNEIKIDGIGIIELSRKDISLYKQIFEKPIFSCKVLKNVPLEDNVENQNGFELTYNSNIYSRYKVRYFNSKIDKVTRIVILGALLFSSFIINAVYLIIFKNLYLNSYISFSLITNKKTPFLKMALLSSIVLIYLLILLIIMCLL